MSNYFYITHLFKTTGLKSPSLNIVQVDSLGLSDISITWYSYTVNQHCLISVYMTVEYMLCLQDMFESFVIKLIDIVSIPGPLADRVCLNRVYRLFTQNNFHLNSH